MKIEKKDMKLQYFPKCPLLIVKEQKHKIQSENHIKNFFLKDKNTNKTFQKKKIEKCFFF